MKKKTKIIFTIICAFIAVAFTIRPIQAQAAGKLSVSDTKLWLNGEGQLVVTYEGHTDEELEVKAKAGSSVKIKTGKWKGDECIVTLTPKKDKNTTLTVTVGKETATVKLYMLKEQVRPAEEIYTYMKDAMVELECVDSAGQVYIGSGFFVGNGLVLTNQHVVEAASKITITDYYGKKYPIKDIPAMDAEHDLILFRVTAKNKGALTFADKVIGGERIYNMGSPAGLTGSFVTGLVANEGYDIDGTRYIQLSMPTGIGSCGGPIVNANGQVLGVMTLVVTSAQNITMAVDFSEVKAFMDTVAAGGSLSVNELYKMNAGKTKSSNDYKIFDGLTDEHTSKAYGEKLKELTSEEIYRLAHEASVDIRIVYTRDGSGVTGSGFFIDDNTVVTNYHVIGEWEPGRTVEITDYNGNTYILDGDAKLNEYYDVAVLKVKPVKEGAKHGHLDIAPNYVPAVGEQLYGMGSPAGYKCTFSEGLTIMSERMIGDLEFINSAVPITAGSSGGPLINKYGQAIGINSRVINIVTNSNLAMPIKYIAKAK